MSELNAGKGGEMQTAGECPFYGNVSGQRATELCHFLLLKKGMHLPQEARKKSNKQPNSTTKATRKGRVGVTLLFKVICFLHESIGISDVEF